MIEFLNFRSIDPVVETYPLMDNPVTIMTLIFSYIMLVFKIGPKYMSNRKPYQLKPVLALYNLFQVFSCIYIIVKLHEQGLSFRNTWKCIPTSKVRDRVWYERLNTFAFILLVKAAEFLETIFFVLRKKQNQVTFLHVYHHISTLLLFWWNFKISSDIMEVFIIQINCYVHVIMYFYYFLAIYEPLQKTLTKVKPLITSVQMIQFVLIFGHVVAGLWPTCKVNKFVFLPHLPNIILIFYMFYQFFVNSYTRRRNRLNLQNDLSNGKTKIIPKYE